RASDIAARYGGEEFCILCPHTDEHQATALANRILRKVRAIELPGAGGHASVSIGVAELR
ncbi:MAG TPA: GGDEF domain-containing protein, partial [Cupriavidus sp.]|nr:GGDEF domain-containing protein [Cupriavidus sp.]